MKWYKRTQVQFAADFRLLPYTTPVKQWLFNIESRLYVNGKKYYDMATWPANGNVTWFSVAVRVLGLDVGFGIYYQGEE